MTDNFEKTSVAGLGLCKCAASLGSPRVSPGQALPRPDGTGRKWTVARKREVRSAAFDVTSRCNFCRASWA